MVTCQNSSGMKAIVMAGGTATRLHPVTISINKHLLPVYDKPMIYYPISILMSFGIREILIISSTESLPSFQRLLGDGNQWGISLSYSLQPQARGTAQAFTIGRKFVGSGSATLALGDNIFFGHAFSGILRSAICRAAGAKIFAFPVNNPQRYGVVDIDANGMVKNIDEKPAFPKSNYAVTGLYCFDNRVCDIAAALRPSIRGELEITDVLRKYLEVGSLEAEIIDRTNFWFDVGTQDSLLCASHLLEAIDINQGVKICCPEEVAFRCGYIDASQLEKLGDAIATSPYGAYLVEVARRGLAQPYRAQSANSEIR